MGEGKEKEKLSISLLSCTKTGIEEVSSLSESRTELCSFSLLFCLPS